MASIDKKSQKILVTGARGFFGSHVVEALEKKGYKRLSLLGGKKQADLREQAVVRDILSREKPDIVVHLAGLVGGILANQEHPAPYFYDNLVMGALMMHEACRAGVKKFLTCIGACSYPGNAPSPIKEEALWDGYPQPESAPYSISKKVMAVQAEAYRREFGFNAVVLLPGNIYGPRDNFDLRHSHVVPALIRKVVEAMERGEGKIEMWGTGAPVRDFVFVKDAAEILVQALETYDLGDIVNISSGEGITIRELTELVMQLTGFKGEVAWDRSKADGQMNKVLDVRRMKSRLHAVCKTSLRDGLRQTIDWYKGHRA